MKIEKINENKIRCFLTRDDLENRHIKLSEIAYGTEKARSLFRDMMEQASSQFGFEADNIPLMVEAIPMSNECIILDITKVADPEELDTRFSRFSPASPDLLDMHKSYLFHRMNPILDVARILSGHYHGENSLYKNPETGDYYLLVSKSDHKPEEFNKVCNILSEYGTSAKYSPSGEAYMKEHYTLLMEHCALQQLALI